MLPRYEERKMASEEFHAAYLTNQSISERRLLPSDIIWDFSDLNLVNDGKKIDKSIGSDQFLPLLKMDLFYHYPIISMSKVYVIWRVGDTFIPWQILSAVFFQAWSDANCYAKNWLKGVGDWRKHQWGCVIQVWGIWASNSWDHQW